MVSIAAPSLMGAVGAGELHVMSFNIRRRMDGWMARPADRWSNRRRALRELLRTEKPSLVGIQEALPDQAEAILDALGARYRRLGQGRDSGGHGEACPLVFDSDRLHLHEWEQQALSDRPSVAGSRSWGNLIPRVLVRAVFRDRATGAEFLAINTHLDPFSARSRRRSAERIRDLVASSPLPAIVTGDFNARPGSPAHRILQGPVPTNSAHPRRALADTWGTSAARRTPEWGTFPDYRRPKAGAGRIDWILASPSVPVVGVGINIRRYHGRWPSDHAPVQAVLRLGDGTPPERKADR